jgi:hypothetical protein
MTLRDLVRLAEEAGEAVDLAEDASLSPDTVRAARQCYRIAIAKLRAHPDYHPCAGVRVGCDWV